MTHSTAIFQHVFYGLSFEKISGMVREFFSVEVPDNEVHVFKELMAIYYRRTYRNLLAKLLAGNLQRANVRGVTIVITSLMDAPSGVPYFSNRRRSWGIES